MSNLGYQVMHSLPNRTITDQPFSGNATTLEKHGVSPLHSPDEVSALVRLL
jgi:hypothetical protein